LASGADPHMRFRDESTPLLVAAENGYLSIVLALLSSGVAVDAICKEGSTPLYAASEHGLLEVVDVLLDHGANVEAPFREGFSPLFVASRNGHAGVVRRLLKAGANIEVNQGDGSTPLYVASQNGHASVVRLLLNANADLRAIFLGCSSLYIAAQNGHDLVVKEIIDYLDTSLRYVRREDILNFARENGETPLYAAAGCGRRRVVARLVENGADINAIYDGHFRPIHIAAQAKHFEIVKLLLKKGALVSGCPIDRLNVEPLFQVLLALKAYIDKAHPPQQPNFFQPPNLSDQRLAVSRLLDDLLDTEDSIILEGLWDRVKGYDITDPELCQQLEKFSGAKPEVPIPRGP
ncbi:MAG: ankyrin repeat domain-containing protein, partial [Gammaproteobacteria bacterium]